MAEQKEKMTVFTYLCLDHMQRASFTLLCQTSALTTELRIRSLRNSIISYGSKSKEALSQTAGTSCLSICLD